MKKIIKIVKTQEIITREYLMNNKNVLFIFGDNIVKKGYGGQAKAGRGLPNAIGIPTKWYPTMQPNAFFSDTDERIHDIYASISKAFTNLYEEIYFGNYDTIIIPKIGEGLADLPNKAPKIYKAIMEALQKFENHIEEVNKL